jgi:hypothetical protein
MSYKWLIPIAIFAVIAYASAVWLSQPFASVPVFLLGLFGLAVAQMAGWVKLFPEKHITLIAIVFVAGLFLTGGLALVGAKFGVSIPTIGATGASVQTVVSGGNPAAAGAAQTCWDKVNPQIRGQAATVTINAWDKESTTPYSAAVDVNPTYVVSTSHSGTHQVSTLSDTSAASMASFSVGDVISVYGGSSSYYLDPVENLCIDSAAFPLDLAAHAVAAFTDMKVSGYDNAGTALTAATNTTLADYAITLGAAQETTFKLRLTTNVAVKSFNLAGVATYMQNNISECEPVAGQFTSAVTPTWLRNTRIGQANADQTNISSGTYTPYVLSSPILMPQWAYQEYNFKIKGGTNDPLQNTAVFASQDLCIVCFIDSTYSRGDDGNVYYDFYAHTAAQGNVGQVTRIDKPVGKYGCTVITGA